MARKNKFQRRILQKDPIFNSQIVTEMINKVMLDGKKSVSEKIVYGALEKVSSTLSKPALEVLLQAIKNASPKMEVKSRRVGGATYQVPIEVSDSRASSLAIKWMIGFARKRKGKSTIDLLAQEIADAYNQTGTTIKKKEETHKMAESNRAFSHFR